MAKTTIIACNDRMGDYSVKLTRDEEGYNFYVLDGREWVPWAEAARVIENCVRGLPRGDPRQGRPSQGLEVELPVRGQVQDGVRAQGAQFRGQAPQGPGGLNVKTTTMIAEELALLALASSLASSGSPN